MKITLLIVIALGSIMPLLARSTTLGLTANDLEPMIYGATEIPGYERIHTRSEPDKTAIVLDETGVWHGLAWVKSRIARSWYPTHQIEQYQRGILNDGALTDEKVSITIALYNHPADALGKTYADYRRQSSGRIRPGTPSGTPLGDESWYLATALPSQTIFFRSGRCFVTVQAPDRAFAEALAIGIAYRLQQHPKLGSSKVMTQARLLVRSGRIRVSGPARTGQAVRFLGGWIAPMTVLTPANVHIQTQHPRQSWTVQASCGKRWIKGKAFGWDMATPSGTVRLPYPFLPYRGQLLGPLRPTAAALGLQVSSQK